MAMTITSAFAAFGASPTNPRWSVSAVSGTGGLVISCWQHLFKPGLIYDDCLSRWTGNRLGSAELQRHLEAGYKNQLDIHLVIARTMNVASLRDASDASKIKKHFSIKREVVGKIAFYDGDQFSILFRKKTD